MAGRRTRRTTPVQREARAANDLVFVRFADDLVELELDVGDVDERIVAALGRVRDALRNQGTTELARYTGLATELDRARGAASADAASVVAHLEGASKSLAALIEWLRLADEAIPYGLGIQAVAALLVEPQRLVDLGETVVFLGLFCPSGQQADRCAVLARWRVERGASYVEASIEAVDEPGGDDAAVAKLLIELAYESHAVVIDARARAVLVVSPIFLAALGDVEDVRRKLIAIGAVRGVAVDLIAVDNPRNLGAVDAALASPQLDFLCLWVEPAAQWGWRRAREFDDRGGQVLRIDVDTVDAAIEVIDAALREIVSGVVEGGGGTSSTLNEAERSEVQSAVAERGMKVVFVGGNETQAQYHAALEYDLEEAHGGGIAIAWFEGWGSSWNVTEHAAHGQMESADAVVLMKMVRTQLGASIRRRSGELGLPWVSCQGTGKQSLMASIEQALLVVARSRAGA